MITFEVLTRLKAFVADADIPITMADSRTFPNTREAVVTMPTMTDDAILLAQLLEAMTTIPITTDGFLTAANL